MNDPNFEMRRRRRLRNPEAPVYDDSMLGGPTIDVEDDPFDGDPNLRREAYSSMGQFIRQDLQNTRGRGEYFVESRPQSQATHESRPDQPRERPRPMTVTPTTYRYTREAEENQEYYDDEDEIDIDDSYEEEEDGYSEDEDDEDEWQEPVRQAPRSRNPYARSPQRYQDDDDYRPRRPPVRPGRSDRYPPEQPRRRESPGRSAPNRRQSVPEPVYPRQRSAPVPPIRRSGLEFNVRPGQGSRSAPSSGATRPTRQPEQRVRNAAAPTHPALLAPDGSIPRNRCGDFLITHIGTLRVSIECQEERREIQDTGLGYHPNMPHIAMINDPRSNARAYFVWNHEKPVQTSG